MSLQREKKSKVQNAQSFGMLLKHTMRVYLTLKTYVLLNITNSCCVIDHFVSLTS